MRFPSIATSVFLFGAMNMSNPHAFTVKLLQTQYNSRKRNAVITSSDIRPFIGQQRNPPTPLLFLSKDINGESKLEVSSLSEKLEGIVNGEEINKSSETETKNTEPLVLEEVPSKSFDIQVESDGPGSSSTTTLTINLGFKGHPEPLVFETGRIGRQASGAITLTRGDTILYSTASRDKEPKEGSLDFIPLSVEHQERFSSAGLTSGSYNRRDGRPAEHEVLTCRLIDRPLRPLIAEGWRHETQLLNWVLSYDGLRSCDPLAITAAAAALWISDIPLIKPVAAAMVGYIDGQLILNPTNEQMEISDLHLTIAGTKDGVMMIEGAAEFLSEEIMIEAVEFGHSAIRIICEAMEEFGKVVGKNKNYSTILPKIDGLDDVISDRFATDVDELWSLEGDKSLISEKQSSLAKKVWAELEEEYPDNFHEVTSAFKKLLCRKMFEKAKDTGLRIDGRKLDEIRPIDIEASILPKVHGSVLFTRGETQAIATATLGDSGMKQKIDKIDGTEAKRFYLQYTFPPSCVGETGRVGAPGRREIGHGNLAERALSAIIPSEEDFPYSIRVESLITESNGSSSMASVCGGCLALMDAGIPVKKPVAGIAMGMLLGDKEGISDSNACILSDILGTEDGLGTMDFKVAGDKEGITTFQLDIKCEGLTIETLDRALQQAKEGRIYILNKMDAVLDKPREELPATIPRMASFNIPEESIGRVIGPGGKQIRAIIEDFELTNMNVQEDGSIQVSSFNTQKMKDAEAFVMDLIKAGGGRGGGRDKGAGKPAYVGPDAEEGKIYTGKITGIHQFGVFVEILPGPEDGSSPGLEGLCHVSELHTERVRNCEGFMNSLDVDTLEVKYLGKNDKGKIQLSRKQVLEERREGRRSLNVVKKPKEPKSEMSKDEVDVISQAIEGIQNL